MHTAVVRPWYREPWPWILAAGPFIVVVAGIYTAWLAVKSNDGLVTDDYYRKGLAANQTIARSDQASKIGLVAGVRVTADTLSVRLRASDKDFVLPPTLVVTISHPTRAGLDQSRVLVRDGEVYSGEVRLPAAGHWLVLLEDERKIWRLMGNMVLPANGETLIGSSTTAATPADIRH
ncbi:FixH family protein [Sulfuritalea sp.]|uniref:FixH family protein n=1 Tax=Sulfuritalea sp. TaxID=2480090 RepID=UPI00286DAEC4|nr:FixH family protein [Sulfuritalea sp.]